MIGLDTCLFLIGLGLLALAALVGSVLLAVLAVLAMTVAVGITIVNRTTGGS